MKSGGKDPSVSSTYHFLSRTRLRYSRHTAEELLSWLTRVGRLCASRGQWARPPTPKGVLSTSWSVDFGGCTLSFHVDFAHAERVLMI